MTLFPAEPEIAAPWLLVLQVQDPGGVLYSFPLMGHSLRQIEEAATRYVDGLRDGWKPYGALLAHSPVRVTPTPTHLPLPYRS